MRPLFLSRASRALKISYLDKTFRMNRKLAVRCIFAVFHFLVSHYGGVTSSVRRRKKRRPE